MKIYAVISYQISRGMVFPAIYYFSLEKEKADNYLKLIESKNSIFCKGNWKVEELESDKSLNNLFEMVKY
jgi:hypothetical protein